MKIVEQTIASLGSPAWDRSLKHDSGGGTVIARWHHDNARVAISNADAIRVVLSLSTGQQVRHADRQLAVSAHSLTGDVTVFAAGVPTETTIEGQADVVQIFIQPDMIGRTARNAMAGTLPIASGSVELKLAAIQLFVAARHSDWARSNAAELRLRQLVCELLTPVPNAARQVTSGGLPPISVRRVEQLIEESINTSGAASPILTELAATTRLSVNHFIRAFRRTRGTTPHQFVISRRCQRAMDLLRQPGLSIAAVSDATGFSSPAHFVASFRQKLGVTPGAYQRAVGQQADL